VQTNILDRGPDNRQATGLCREDINLVGALSHEASETFDGVGRLNVTMHDRWKSVKGQQMLFILRQAPYCFRVALRMFGFERLQVGQRILLLLLRARCL
jgi:hypothetical protein